MATTMKTAKKNDYSRLYALLRKHPQADKDELVLQFTGGRTSHVSEMKRDEFIALCDALQYGSEQEQLARTIALKRARSSALLRIARLGINTIDNWDGINAFVSSPKIAGKKFYDLSTDELNALTSKLESIIRKGGLKKSEESQAQESAAPLNNTQIVAMMQIASANSNNRKHLN